ncbi:MAG: CDP-alcohol phosphatidyltransferase family protein [Eubacteriaceae bacterium]|nr:CDP-alcohol phosphatidyltransferase family protein [Eubacteriaceae bacterium]
MANAITFTRILLSIGLLFCPALSAEFFILYLAAGFTDMIDGTVARRTGTDSEFGSKLDTAADFVFVTTSLIKLLPVIKVPIFIYVWVGIIALIKLINIVSGYMISGKIIAVHSIMNKLTGACMFAAPFTFVVFEPKYSAVILCIIATVAAIHEGYLIITDLLYQA